MTPTLSDLLSRYGLWGVLAGTFFEGEGVVMAAGVLSSSGLLRPLEVWVAAAFGAWTGHLFWFFIGRRFGTRYLLPRFAPLREGVARVNSLVRRHPGTAVVMLQYLYGARMFGAIAFGMTQFPVVRFTAYEAVNCAVWAALVEATGYFVGEAAGRVMSGWGRWIWVAASIGVLIGVLRILKRRESLRRG